MIIPGSPTLSPNAAARPPGADVPQQHSEGAQRVCLHHVPVARLQVGVEGRAGHRCSNSQLHDNRRRLAAVGRLGFCNRPIPLAGNRCRFTLVALTSHMYLARSAGSSDHCPGNRNTASGLTTRAPHPRACSSDSRFSSMRWPLTDWRSARKGTWHQQVNIQTAGLGTCLLAVSCRSRNPRCKLDDSSRKLGTALLRTQAPLPASSTSCREEGKRKRRPPELRWIRLMATKSPG